MRHLLHMLLIPAAAALSAASLTHKPISASFTLAEHGIVLEVADSTIADAGRGVFVRCVSESGAKLPGGLALCGYAAGTTRQTADPKATNAVAFCLRDAGFDELHLPDIGPDAAPVWFEGALCTASSLLARDDVDEIAGHMALFDELGELDALLVDEEQPGFHFCPDAEQPPPGLATLGILFNDLAYNDDTPTIGYEAAAAEANLVSHVFEAVRDAENPRRLVPKAPLVTLMRDVTLTNTEPVEVGAFYGADYWGLEWGVSLAELEALGLDANELEGKVHEQHPYT